MFELYNNYNNYFGSKSNKNDIWNVGIYTRLSREDEKDNKFNKQSESIENQIKFLKSYVNSQNWNIVKIYTDDGYSGTNFDRPDFKNMISDIENNTINMVVTKDLSRLGRDYIDTGYYIEKYFPSRNIRYIAVTDNVDTYDMSNTNNDMTPFKAVVNDMYAKDTSKKVRATLLTKAMNGESIKSFQPYGYKKDPNNKNKIIVDRVVSDNVFNIFEMYKSGKTKKEICNILNDKGIITPLRYKEQTSNYCNPNKGYYLWSSSMITKILRDQIYTGDLVQHKTTKVNYKVKKTIKLEKEAFIVVENNHEPIVDKNTFKTVQTMLDKQANEWNYSNKEPHLLKGLVYCSCGAKITYNKNHGKYFRCVCSTYKKSGVKFCNNIQYLREDKLINEVLKALQNNVNRYLDTEKLKYKGKKTKNKVDSSNELKIHIELIDRKLKDLYEDKLNGIISTEMFMQISKDYEKQKKELKQKLDSEKNNKSEEKTRTSYEAAEKYINEVLKLDDITKVDRNLLIKLIDKIIIDNKKISSISYNFSIPKL